MEEPASSAHKRKRTDQDKDYDEGIAPTFEFEQAKKRHRDDLESGRKSKGAEKRVESSRKRAKQNEYAKEEEEEEGDDDSEEATMELDVSSDGNAVDEDGDGYFDCQLELFGEAVQGRRTRVIQKRWRPDKTFSIGREQFATSSSFHRIGLDRISRQHFEIRCGRVPETHAGRSAKRKRHASSTKRCFFLKDLSANGTHLNDELLGKGVERELCHRDTITVLMSSPGERRTLIGYRFSVVKAPASSHSNDADAEAWNAIATQEADTFDPPASSSPVGEHRGVSPTRVAAVVGPSSSRSPASSTSPSASPPAKAFRSMGKATQYHGDNKLSYSLKVSTHSSISVSAQSNREVMFITTPALEEAAPAASDIPAPLPLGDSTTPTATDVQQPLKQQPPRRSEWRALLVWLLGRLGTVLYILATVGIKVLSLYLLVMSVYNYFFAGGPAS